MFSVVDADGRTFRLPASTRVVDLKNWVQSGVKFVWLGKGRLLVV